MKTRLLSLLLAACLLTGCNEKGQEEKESGQITNTEGKTENNTNTEANEEDNDDSKDGGFIPIGEKDHSGDNEESEEDNVKPIVTTDPSDDNKESQEHNNGNEGENSGTEDDETGSQEETGSDDDNQQTQEETTYTAYFKTTGAAFEQALKARSQLSNEGNYQNNVNALESYIRTYLDDGENLLTRLTFSGYVQTLDAEGGVYISLGSKSSNGTMTWKSNKKIKKVEVTVKNYYKTYVNGGVPGVSVDDKAHFKLDNIDYSLELAANTTPESKTFTANYDNDGVNSFSVSSLDGRVLLESFSITWVK